MKLIKENFNYNYSGDKDHWNWELANHPRYTNPWTEDEAIKIRDQILENQKDATAYRLRLHRIVTLEKENKRLKEELQYTSMRIKGLQEINDKLRATIEGDCQS